MTVSITDLTKAVEDLEVLKRKWFVTMEPIYDEDERSMIAALAVLRQLIKEASQP